ncbi:hypothetical protein AAFF_G00405820 [Aldrovandia affinis]|uniref:Uncharacterized protein n=1 Tax=Aldrovandia affinis TaxID=143900 RepID=A0AAD7WK49_9TELE|nr:hypothetical protein AAFF_G00405820 [Aldrovandia affinis]
MQREGLEVGMKAVDSCGGRSAGVTEHCISLGVRAGSSSMVPVTEMGCRVGEDCRYGDGCAVKKRPSRRLGRSWSSPGTERRDTDRETDGAKMEMFVG